MLMQFVLHCGLIFMAYLVDIPNDGACFFTCLAHYALYCDQHSLPKPIGMPTDPSYVRHYLCNYLEMNRDTVMIEDKKKPLTVEQCFLKIYGESALLRKAVHFENLSHDRIFCNSFEEYIGLMRNRDAHADEIFVWAASMMFNIKISVLEHFVPRIEDPNLKTLVEMGYPRTAAEHALQQCSDNLDDAIDFLIDNPPQPSESNVIWRETMETHGLHIDVHLARTGMHFQLLLPEYVPRDIEPKLPPRKRKEIVAAQMMWVEHNESHGCGGGEAAVSEQSATSSRKPSANRAAVSHPHLPQKPSAGGGAAAISCNQSSPSFGHSQPPCPPKKPAHLSSSHIVEYDGSRISGLSSKFGLYDKVIPFAKDSRPFRVTNLTLVNGDLTTVCEDGVHVFSSFITSEKRRPEVRFRAVCFQFEDGTVVNHTGTAASLSDKTEKDKFMDRVNRKWQSFMITAITFARCN